MLNYMYKLILPWQALQQRLKGKHGLVLNEGADFHLTFYGTQIYRAFKEKRQKTNKQKTPHNTQNPVQVKYTKRQKPPVSKY